MEQSTAHGPGGVVDAAVLAPAEWQARRARHQRRVDALVAGHLDRRRRGEAHPVEDFLFTYYSHRPARLRRWFGGWGVAVAEPDEVLLAQGHVRDADGHGVVDPATLQARRPLVVALERLLRATASRPAATGCFGLHEWAMVYRSEDVRHRAWPLRLGAAGTDAVVEGHRISCTHFDAYRFFTNAAAPRNTLRPAAHDREAYEQPGCLHAGMDLYKHAYRLAPLVPAELVVDCFDLAREIRTLDMRASPYDLSGLGYEPVAIETPSGKQAYVAAQRSFAERAAPLRQRLVDACTALARVSGARVGNAEEHGAAQSRPHRAISSRRPLGSP